MTEEQPVSEPRTPQTDQPEMWRFIEEWLAPETAEQQIEWMRRLRPVQDEARAAAPRGDGALREQIDAKIAVLSQPDGTHRYDRGIHKEVADCGACSMLHTLRWVRAALGGAAPDAGHTADTLDVERLGEALETEWYNGNLDEKAYRRLAKVARVSAHPSTAPDREGPAAEPEAQG